MSIKTPLGATADGGAFETAGTAGHPDPAAAHAQRHPVARPRAELIGIGATVAVPLLGLVLCAAGTRSAALVPQSIGLAPWASGMTGPLAYLGFSLGVGGVVAALLTLLGLYLIALRHSELVPNRLIVGAVVAFTVVALVGPPLFSTDAFSYQAYARMLAHYHINPYLHGPDAIGSYPLTNTLTSYIGAKWVKTPSVYGPLFTFLSVIFQSRSVAFNYYAFKVIAALASGGTLLMIWRLAGQRGVNQRRAIALFGLNPLVTLYGVGGGHNDLLMLLLMTGGVYAILARRDGAGAVLLTAGAAVKLTGGIVLPFALVGELRQGSLRTRGRSMLIGIAVPTAIIAGASYAVFGTGILHMLSALQAVQWQGAWQSLPGLFFSLARAPVSRGVRIADDVVLAAVILWLLHRVWRGRLDWVEAAAWATFAVLATAWSLLPWYSAWLLPLVAISAERRVWRVAVAATLMGSAIMVAGCFPSWNWL
ncbi:MAG TPA: polyprenol phosphomannose-dependent alpha 1,6 mannosyltransferase MptB [Solirubrobacteraceae bacterium]|nr:polyprenol phosphomannose-dependent alpha 1,6 mannosyltransferase MptB [Solirubrobacteraceae bacterium]